MIQRVLLAYDGSRDGRLALREGACLAGICRAAVHLLAVVSLPHPLAMAEAPVPQERVDASFREARALLEAGVLRLQGQRLAAMGHLAVGRPAPEIARYARDLECDLIVLGHRRETAAADWRKEAVGEALLDLAPCSLLIAQGSGIPRSLEAGRAVARDLLDFWFGDPGSPGFGELRPMWFQKDPAIDTAICARFTTLFEAAADGGLDHWRQDPEGALALTLLLDQVSRHLYRDRGEAFAFDADARVVARGALEHRLDAALLPVQRAFLYLPFEHSEDMADQDRAVALFAALTTENPDLASFYEYAVRHRAIIARFGRFPHRNALLGRMSTPEESAFLIQPGSRF